MKTPGYRAWVQYIAAYPHGGRAGATTPASPAKRDALIDAVSELFDTPVPTVERAVKAELARQAKRGAQ